MKAIPLLDYRRATVIANQEGSATTLTEGA